MQIVIILIYIFVVNLQVALLYISFFYYADNCGHNDPIAVL